VIRTAGASLGLDGRALLPGLLGVGMGLTLALRPELALPLLVGTALAVAVLVVRDPVQALLLALVGGTVTLGRGFPYLLSVGPVYLTEVVISVLGLLLIISVRRSGLPSRVGVLLVAYFSIGVLAVLIGWGNDPYWIARDSVLVAYAILIWLVAATLRSRTAAERLLDVMFWAGAASILVWATGVEYPPVAFGVYAAFAYLPVLVAWADGKRVAWWKLAIVGVGLYYLVTLEVRASWFAFAAALLVLALSRPRRSLRLPYAGAWIGVLTVFFVWFTAPSLTGTTLGQSLLGVLPSTETIESRNSSWRVEYWKYELSSLAEKPIGHGFGPASFFCSDVSDLCEDTRLTRETADFTGPHNSFVNIAYRTGVQGIAVLIALLAAILMPAWRAMRRTGDTAIRTALVMLTFAAATAFFAVSLEGPYMAVPFWSLLGLIIVLTRTHGEPQGPESHDRGGHRAEERADTAIEEGPVSRREPARR
jgi:O-antigen ligase